MLAAAIARQVANLIQANPRPQLVDATTLATRLGVSRDYVYAHAEELGGRRIGSGPRGRLRFDLHQALAAWTTQPDKPTARQALPPPARPRRPSSCPSLLPVRGSTISTRQDRGRS